MLDPKYYRSEWERSNIPVQLWDLRLEEYKAINGTGEAAALASEKFLDELHNHYVPKRRALAEDISSFRWTIGKGMMFIGPNGTRKTTLATSILTEAKYLDNSISIYYIRFDDWLKALKNTFNKDSEIVRLLGQSRLDRAATAGILVIDDIGQEHRPDAYKQNKEVSFGAKELHEFLRRRYEAGTPTIATSNLSEEEFEDIYGESFESFRRDAFDIHVIVGDDTRKK